MATTALLLVAVAAIAAGTAGGSVLYTDLHDFSMDIKVTDAITNGPVAGAQVEIRDANNVLVAQGLTHEDGEYELEVDHDGVDDSDDQGDDDCEGQHAERNASLRSVDDGMDDSDDQGDDDCEEQYAEHNASLGSIVGPLTITISKIGYETQTFTVNIDTLDDSDIKVKLVPSA
jgi:hypothetical protein